MTGEILALLVHDRPGPLESLKSALKDLSIRTFSVRTCEAAQSLIHEVHADLVFTDTSLPDGSWADIVDLAQRGGAPVSVVVVGSNQDTKLYLSALERGAFDFVLPPFETHALNFVVYSALDNTRRQRQARVH